MLSTLKFGLIVCPAKKVAIVELHFSSVGSDLRVDRDHCLPFNSYNTFGYPTPGMELRVEMACLFSRKGSCCRRQLRRCGLGQVTAGSRKFGLKSRGKLRPACLWGSRVLPEVLVPTIIDDRIQQRMANDLPMTANVR
jgi:hypothetical protein